MGCADADTPCQTEHLERACLALRGLGAAMGSTLGQSTSESVSEASVNCDRALPHIALGDRDAAGQHLTVMNTHIVQATAALRVNRRQ